MFYTRDNSQIQALFNAEQVDPEKQLTFLGRIEEDEVRALVQGGSKGPFLAIKNLKDGVIMGYATLFANDYGVPKMRLKMDKHASTIWLEVDFSAPKSVLSVCGLDLDQLVSKKAAYLLEQFSNK